MVFRYDDVLAGLQVQVAGHRSQTIRCRGNHRDAVFFWRIDQAGKGGFERFPGFEKIIGLGQPGLAFAAHHFLADALHLFELGRHVGAVEIGDFFGNTEKRFLATQHGLEIVVTILFSLQS